MGKVKRMKKEVRIAILATVIVMIAAAAFGVVGYMSPTTPLNQIQDNNLCSKQPLTQQQISELKQILSQNKSIPSLQLEKALNLLKNGNISTYTGSIVLVSNQIMVLNVTGQTINIIMAQKWVVGGQVLTLHELFVKGTLSNGQQITVSALTIGQGHLWIAWGYKILTSTGTIPAFLPFNIK